MLDVFIEGEIIDLAVPTLEFAEGDIWYKWFNDRNITKYLDQGVYPNTPDLQKETFKSLRENRMLLIIQSKRGKPIGVISLSFINHVKKSCDYALVVDTNADLKNAAIGALEASARIIEHGFEALGMQRISAGQHKDLAKWEQRLELIGFKLEGYHIGRAVKGASVSDSVSLAVNYEDYVKLKTIRGGHYWDSANDMMRRIKSLPSRSFRAQFEDFFSRERAEYYDSVFNL